MEKEIYEVKEVHENATEKCIIGKNSSPIKDTIIENLKDLYKTETITRKYQVI